MISLSKRFTATALLLLGASGSLGCELLATVDRSLIPGEGGAGGSVTTTTTGGSATGGSGGTTTSSTSSTTETGGTGGTTTTSSSTTSGTGGEGGSAPTCATPGGTTCSTAADCPAPVDACTHATCEQSCCGTAFDKKGVTAAAQALGDCQVTVCDGAGGTFEIPDDADRPDDAGACQTGACVNGVAVQLAKVKGLACKTSGGQFCDGAGACVACLSSADCTGSLQDTCDTATGACVAATCTDQKQSGYETDVDCGGAPGSGCGACADGKHCVATSDCGTNSICRAGVCAAASCTDGVKDAPGGQAETDVDCGGATCRAQNKLCADAKICAISGDCQSGFCNPTTKLCAAPTCADGFANGAETDVDCGGTCAAKCGTGKGCAGAADCASGVCTGGHCQAPICGDGVVNGGDACDDGNATNLDGCSAACQVDVFAETEPNNTTGTANGPFNHGFLVHGALQTGADVDLYAVQLPATADLRIETFEHRAQGTCANIDTVVTLLAPDGTTVLASDDDSGVGSCSLLDGKKLASLRHMPAGTYFVEVEAFNHYQPIPTYDLVVTFDALCGDGVKQGAEECDGGGGCTATCDRVPTCGDGFLDGSEACDDGNTTNGDGCSATCQYEVLGETEPNNSAATANGPRHPGQLLGGAISPATDVDYVAIQLTATTDLRLETFDASGPGSCNAIDTVLTLLAPDGTTALISRDQGGLGNCSRIDPALAGDKAAAHLPAGTYFAKVESHLNAFTISGYRLLVTQVARCGDGVVEGAEECDGGAGCTATCDRVPTCGDGFIDGSETCDDGNTTAGDGCSATCALELVNESEANDTPATADGPFAAHTLLQGSLLPAGDVDFFAIQVAKVSDIEIEVFDGNGPGSCVNIDPVATLYAPDGTTALAFEDDGGIATCSKLTPAVDPGVRHLAPGTYYLEIKDFITYALPAYRVEIRFKAVCGDGKVEGYEECDGGPGCDASCNRVPTCGDGYVDAPETCDDGNTTSGDGCSATCALETTAEAEPNDTTAQASAAPVMVTGSAYLTGAIGAVGDKDLFMVMLAQPTVVRFETMDPTGFDCTIATTLRLYDASGTQLFSDDNGGMSTCSALVVSLAAGNYYVGVEERGNDATLAGYLLDVRFLASAGSESEPDDTSAQAKPLSGRDVFVLGGHQSNGDTDWYAVTVPQGKSIRAEIIEGGSETCESLDVDSFLTLYDASGVAIAADDDSGRGFCSRIDGTGSAPANTGASELPAGTYYLAVEAAPFAQGASDTTGQFDYRLVVTIR